MKPVNILYLINELGYGGTEGQLVQLIRGLDPREFQASIGVLYGSSVFLEELEIPSIHLYFKGFRERSAFLKIARLSRFVEEQKIRLVQTFFQDPHLVGTFLKCVAPIRLIGSFRDMGFACTRSTNAKIRLSNRFYDGYIANSEAVKTHSVNSFGIRPRKINVIHNGFARKMCARPSNLLDGVKTVGIVANLNREVKRVADFVAMAAHVKTQVPDARFVVVGEGHLKQGLLELSHRLGLDGSISFLGSLSDPLEEIRKFKVGVIASESEGLSNAIIEYLACGVPVVATHTGGNPELVVPGENGYLVPVGRPALMAEKVILLLRDRSLALEMGAKSRAKVLAHFSTERMIDRHQAFYSDIMEGRRWS